MLLVRTTIGGQVRRLSAEGLALEHYWDAQILGFAAPRYATQHDWGGHCRMGYGQIQLAPGLFAGAWPPPATLDLDVYYTATDEAAAETMFTGLAHLRQVSDEQVAYDLYQDDYTATIASGTAYDATLVSVMGTLATALGLSVDSALARSPSPTVKYSLTTAAQAIALADLFCAFYTHLFYIEGSSLVLVDMAADNGSRTLTEFDFIRAQYERNAPAARAVAGNFAAFSAHGYGQQLDITAAHDTEANVVAALGEILAYHHAARATVTVPFAGGVPRPGESVSWTDTAQGADTAMTIRARDIAYDFDNEEIQITGEGAMTAA